MSTTVRSRGFIGILLVPLGDDEIEDLNERLYDEKSNLMVIGDGTMIYSDEFAHKSMSEREDIYDLNIGYQPRDDKEAFELLVEKYNFEVVSIRPYNCIWYNGSDSPLWLLTLEEYEAKL